MLGRLFAQLLKPRPPASSGEALAAALSLHRAGDYARAEAECRALLVHAPDNADALHVLGVTLLAQRKWDAAVSALTRAATLDSGSADVHYNLGNAYKGQGTPGRAVECFAKALEVNPSRVEAQVSAAGPLSELGRYAEAEAGLRDALAARPDLAEAHYNLALVLVSMQRFEEAMACYRAALGCNPAFLFARSNLLLLMNAHSTDPDAIMNEHRAWGRQHAAPLAGAHLPFSNTAEPSRRVRLAYLSSDLRDHPVGRFIEPVLAQHDHGAFEVWCYHADPIDDLVTTRLRSRVDRWINCANMDDEALANRIRADGIDVLVDLAGHTAGNRLLAVARHPAPVMATYLGYPTTSGIDAIGYRVTDVHVDPPGTNSYTVERAMRLPHSYYCYGGEDEVTGVTASPTSLNHRVTFGCFNACIKWSDASIELWARVLDAVTGSTLLLKAKGLDQAEVAERALQRFATHGVDTGRIELRGWEPTPARHLAIYREIDIALDTYPYNGATTTCEALWMGVPVVTLTGPTHASRMGASVLEAAGTPQWIARSPEQYVEICAALARDSDALQAARATLRARLHASPLMDAARFTADLECLYREMWRSWCSRAG
ncbi:MAG: repeat-containing protein [Betaproteobacteria bacterium]|nr:repeat-containing protein [Betaproteobacteria bacterium]